MSLRAKLGRLSAIGPPREERPVPPPVVPPKRQAQSLRRALTEPVQTPYGLLHLSDRDHAPHYLQGNVRVAEAARALARTLSSLALDPGLAEVDPRRMLLLDTETTGLHGGAGTLPFLVGMAWFEGDSLRVRQLFLRRPGEEAPLLKLLAERMDAASVLVTYNGKCFDWPLLRTRFVMNRISPPGNRPHLDLLHACRRVFKRRLGGVRLVDLEVAVLRHERGEDIDGGEIPEAYFDFLRRGDPSRLEQVLEHNVQDLVSLAALVAALCRQYEQVGPEDDPRDCLSLAKVAARAGEMERAIRFAEEAAQRGGEPSLVGEALAFLATAISRRGDHARAAMLWERLVGLPRVPAEQLAHAHLSLAKLYEHGLKVPERALDHARRGALAEAPQTYARRLARLTRRAQARAALFPLL